MAAAEGKAVEGKAVVGKAPPPAPPAPAGRPCHHLGAFLLPAAPFQAEQLSLFLAALLLSLQVLTTRTLTIRRRRSLSASTLQTTTTTTPPACGPPPYPGQGPGALAPQLPGQRATSTL